MNIENMITYSVNIVCQDWIYVQHCQKKCVSSSHLLLKRALYFCWPSSQHELFILYFQSSTFQHVSIGWRNKFTNIFKKMLGQLAQDICVELCVSNLLPCMFVPFGSFDWSLDKLSLLIYVYSILGSIGNKLKNTKHELLILYFDMFVIIQCYEGC